MQILPINRQPNFFTRLPPDVCRMIGLLAGGRAFARLGGCCCQLNQLVKKATLVWKHFYIENNWGINPVSELDWNEKYCFQELIKRNIRCNNYTQYQVPTIPSTIGKENVFFRDGQFHFRINDKIVSCDLKGKLGESIPKIEMPKQEPKTEKYSFRASVDKIELWDPSLEQYVLFASVAEPIEVIVEGNRLTTRWFYQMIVWDIETKMRVLEFPGTIGRKDFENVSNTLLVAYSLPLSLQTFTISKMRKISTARTVLFNGNGFVVTGFPDRHVTIYDFTQSLPPKRWWNRLGL